MRATARRRGTPVAATKGKRGVRKAHGYAPRQVVTTITHGHGDALQKDVQGAREAFDAQQIVAVGGHRDVVQHASHRTRGSRRLGHDTSGARRARAQLARGILRQHIIELDAELERELVKLLVLKVPSQPLKELIAIDADSGHSSNSMVHNEAHTLRAGAHNEAPHSPLDLAPAQHAFGAPSSTSTFRACPTADNARTLNDCCVDAPAPRGGGFNVAWG